MHGRKFDLARASATVTKTFVAFSVQESVMYVPCIPTDGGLIVLFPFVFKFTKPQRCLTVSVALKSKLRAVFKTIRLNARENNISDTSTMPTTKGRPKKLKQRQIENVGKTSVLQKPKSAATETTSKVKPVKKTQKSVVKKKKRIGGKPKAN